MFLKTLTYLREKAPSHDHYPFSVPSLRDMHEIEFTANVTFFVGENGSGKSTLLEAIAHQIGFNVGGGSQNQIDELPASESVLTDCLRLSWMPKISNGFFLRAESFFTFASHIDEMAREFPGQREKIYAPYGGKSLHVQSHGEAFISLFLNRFGKKGIYLLDEPEAALSPARQLSLLRVLRLMEEQGQSQFLIATHSPILLGYPGAQILNFDTAPLSEIRYEETDHYLITKRFLGNREAVLDELFQKD